MRRTWVCLWSISRIVDKKNSIFEFKIKHNLNFKREMKMKLFETIQENMATMGFTPNQQQNHQRQFNSGQFCYIFKYSMDLISITVYIFREAESVDEYIESVFSLTVVGGVLIAFICIFLKNDKLFSLFESIAEEETLSTCSDIFRFFLLHSIKKRIFFRIEWECNFTSHLRENQSTHRKIE